MRERGRKRDREKVKENMERREHRKLASLKHRHTTSMHSWQI